MTIGVSESRRYLVSFGKGKVPLALVKAKISCDDCELRLPKATGTELQNAFCAIELVRTQRISTAKWT